MMSATTIAERLDAAVAPQRLLDHPFYKAWAEGALTRDDLSFYSTQYWRQVEAFPGYLTSLANRLEGGAKETIEANLDDEVGDDHPGLWLDFAAAVGVDSEKVRATAPEPETQACVDAFSAAARTASLPFALGMLYGYESQTPGVARTKIEGLRTHYGIDGPGLDYFSLHGELDVRHSAELADTIATVVEGEEAVAEAEAGAAAGARVVWGLLDGVVRSTNCA